MLKWGSESYRVDRRCGVAEMLGVTELLVDERSYGGRWSEVEIGYGVAEVLQRCGVMVYGVRFRTWLKPS